MKLRDIFELDITRDIPPVVYFHEQSPEKIADEVREYIITGGWPEGHPNRNRVPDGIHEQYVRLLSAIAAELDKKGGPDLPNAWISGFYGSGKSSFAKLLGLALDGKSLPDGTSVAEALLARDTSPRSQELRDAWAALRAKVDPMAVVFDVGGKARDSEHVHGVLARMVQDRLGYSRDPLTADYELRLERDGEWARFEKTAREVLGHSWEEARHKSFADDDFSRVLHAMYPERYPDEMAWIASRAGSHAGMGAPEDVVTALRDMMSFRAKGKTLFVVVDEVSQYVLGSSDRLDRLRAFATALGSGLKGQVWFIALGQQKLDDEAEHKATLGWVKDRFPPRLRVHLSATNIRDVIHRRLLTKKANQQAALREAFEHSRTDLKLFAWGCDAITPEDFVEVYPLLPGHIDLLLQITTALRLRSTRAQGDDQAIRGLLQMLGELFRDQQLSDAEVGTLITFDRIYDVQHTALDADAQASMARILAECAGDTTGLSVRVAKVVALLELVQETIPTTAKTVAQVLYDRLDRGNNVTEVTAALEDLTRRNLLGFSEREGYRLQSSSGEEWERERREQPVGREQWLLVVQDQLRRLLSTPDKPSMSSRSFALEGVFSDGRRPEPAILVDSRDDATIRFDFRLVPLAERNDAVWIPRSAESGFQHTLLWVAGESEDLEEAARSLEKSKAMVRRYGDRQSQMTAARKMLLQSEKNRLEDLERQIKTMVGNAWLAGTIYFRGEGIEARHFGNSFMTALSAVANRKLPDIYHRFVSTVLAPSELLQLVEPELSAPSTKFLGDELGILELDAGRYVPGCSGSVPLRVLEAITSDNGLGGTALLAHFGSPPYGFHPTVVKACVAGLLRASKIKVVPEVGDALTAVRDAGVRELFEKDRAFKRASFFPVGDDGIGYQARARICKFFEEQLQHPMDREDHHIADAVQACFPGLAGQLREVEGRLARLPGRRGPPATLQKLATALEQCLRQVRQTQPTVLSVKKHLDALRDGVQLLRLIDAELTEDAVKQVVDLHNMHQFQGLQIIDLRYDTPRPVVDAITILAEQVDRDRPWTDLRAAQAAADVVRAHYVETRSALLAKQEGLVDDARRRVKLQAGFSVLTADQSHEVLRPLQQVLTETSADAVSPPLSQLGGDRFESLLHRAEDEAIARLDELRSSKPDTPTVVPMPILADLRRRELGSEAEVDALLAELRARLVKQLQGGQRIRLV